MALEMKIRSCIKSALLRRALWRGTFLAIGVLTLLFLYSLYFDIGGIVIFGLGIVLITAAFVPYKKLKKLEMNPDAFVVYEQSLTYIQNGKKVFSVSFENLSAIRYHEKKSVYGIVLSLKDKQPSGDLFFPYFTSHACTTLIESVNPDKTIN